MLISYFFYTFGDDQKISIPQSDKQVNLYQVSASTVLSVYLLPQNLYTGKNDLDNQNYWSPAKAQLNLNTYHHALLTQWYVVCTCYYTMEFILLCYVNKVFTINMVFCSFFLNVINIIANCK